MNYVKLHTDALLAYKRLSDTEFGRAVRAVLQYVEDGTEPNLPGKESIMFDVLREQVERDRKSYDKRVEAQRENGSKGGRPRKNQKPTETHGFLENPTKPTETQITQEKEKEYIPPYNPPKGVVDEEEEAMLAQNELLNEVFDRAKVSGFMDIEANRLKFVDRLRKYGKDTLFFALDECVKSQVLNFRYLDSVLANAKPPEKEYDYAADYL